MDGPVIGYVRICVDPFGWPQGAICTHFGPKNWVFFINYIRILRFTWDLQLTLFDSPKDVVSETVLVFDRSLYFPGVNWAQKWTKTVNFGYVLLSLKDTILEDCSYNMNVHSFL